MKKLLIFLAVSAVLLSGCSASKKASSSPTADTASPATPVQTPVETPLQSALKKINFQLPSSEVNAPDFRTSYLAGGELTLSSFKGKTVLLNFWATWCPPCRDEMPTIQRFYDRYKDSNTVILAVNIGEDEATVSGFIKETGYSFPVLMDQSQTIASHYGIQAIPTTFVIGPDGKMLARIVSSFSWDSSDMFGIFDSL